MSTKTTLLVIAACAAHSLGALPPLNDTTNIIGINNGFIDYWEESQWFANLMHHSAEFRVPGSWNTFAAVDADGWPTEDFVALVASKPNMHGTYRVIFTGQGTPEMNKGGTTVSSEYDPMTNTTQALIRVTDATEGHLRLTVRGVSGPIRDIKLMSPISPGSDTPCDTSEIVNRATRTLVQECFDYVRYMNLLETNHNPQKSWADRTLPTDPIQGKRLPCTVDPADSNQVGACWEFIVLSANELQRDAWICIPHAVDDDYMRNVAKLFRYGSDGVNPYDGPVAGPLYPPLDPNLKLYVEYSNEVWNWMFRQTRWVDAEAKKTPELSWHQLKASRSARMSLIFREVFGDDQMMTRILPLLEWQKGGKDDDLGNAQRTAGKQLVWLDQVYCQGKTKSDGSPMTVDYLFWGGGGTGYYNPGSDVTLDEVWTTGDFPPDSFMFPKQEWMIYWTSAFGLHRAVYEGGPSFGDQNAGSGMNPIGDAALRDDRMIDALLANQQAYSKGGGTSFAYFVLGGNARWGFMQGHMMTHKKVDAVRIAKDALRSPISTVGNPVVLEGPSTVIAGGTWKLCNRNEGRYGVENTDSSDAGVSIPRGIWHSYPFHIDRPGVYRVRISSTSATGNTVRLFLGSDLLGEAEVAVAPSPQPSPWYETTLYADRVHSVRVQPLDGDLTLTNVEIEGIAAVAGEPRAPREGQTAPAHRIAWRHGGRDLGLTVTLRNPADNAVVSVMALDGRCLARHRLHNGRRTHTLSVRSAPQSVVVVLDCAGSRVSRVVVSRGSAAGTRSGL